MGEHDENQEARLNLETAKAAFERAMSEVRHVRNNSELGINRIAERIGLLSDRMTERFESFAKQLTSLELAISAKLSEMQLQVERRLTKLEADGDNICERLTELESEKGHTAKLAGIASAISGAIGVAIGYLGMLWKHER